MAGAPEALLRQPSYDVIVIGGGLAGLSLAAQIKKVREKTSVLVLDRNPYPAPEAAFKVGESSAETGSVYLADFVGIREHLESEQLPKHGLRFFLPAGASPINERFEIGSVGWPDAQAFQLDRGRLENFLHEEVRRRGVELLEECRVVDVELAAESHQVSFVKGGVETRVTGRWVVDASGRPGFLKRKLDLAKPIAHEVNAVWWRLGIRVDVEDWSDSGDWLARVPSGRRWLSTNHLLGDGYWVWVIPLASGATSIGIVAEESRHPFDSINTLERAQAWLEKYEPQCAAELGAQQSTVLDFRVQRNFVLGAKRVFSPDRWCLTGDAGTFLDPLYSVGTNFIGTSNTLITEFLTRELDGEDVRSLVEWANGSYLLQFDNVLKRFVGLYPVMGNGAAFFAQLVWNLASFWSVPALLFCQRRSNDQPFMASVAPFLQRYGRLNASAAGIWREWARREPNLDLAPGFFDPLSIPMIHGFHSDLVAAPLEADALRSKIEANLESLESLATTLFRLIVGVSPPDAYRLDLPDDFPLQAGPPADVAADGTVEAQLAANWPRRRTPATR